MSFGHIYQTVTHNSHSLIMFIVDTEMGVYAIYRAIRLNVPNFFFFKL